jgi:hypothetical protein
MYNKFMSNYTSQRRALQSVFHGETHEFAIKANQAFDRRAAATASLTDLIIDRTYPEEGVEVSWNEIGLKAGELATANSDFVHLESLAASCTPPRSELDSADASDVAYARDSASHSLIGSGM